MFLVHCLFAFICREIQFVVLSNIASMSAVRPTLFDAYLKSFYVRSNDPTQIKLLKLEILTNLATETSISTILREFQVWRANLGSVLISSCLLQGSNGSLREIIESASTL